MSRDRRNRNVHPLRIVFLAAALGLVVVGLSQCRLASDVTGVEVQAGRLSSKGQCIKACNDDYSAAKRAEEDRYRDATKACGKDKDCKDKVKADHDRISDQLDDARKACKKGCYNEGGGNGGA
jgi:hypothetical protein